MSVINKESDKIENYKTLEILCEEIKQSWIEIKDKTNIMEKIINILKDINSKKSLEEYFDNNEKDLQYFLDTFIQTVMLSILNQPYVQGKNGDDIALELLFQIYLLFSNFHHNKKYYQILQCIRKLFENNSNFSYFFPLNKMKKPKDSLKNCLYKDFNKEFCNDFINKDIPEIIFNVGDNVDILVENNESHYFLDKTAWVRGKIKKIEEGNYFIRYNREEKEIIFPLGSPKVLKEGTKTTDWEWRTNLHKYDLVDAFYMDQWWPASIIDIEEITENDGIKSVKYKIGYRLYLDHFKNEEDPSDYIDNYLSFWDDKKIYIDENKQEYKGFHPENDELIFHFSKRIQKFNSFSEIEKQTKEAGTKQILNVVNNDLANDNIKKNENIDKNILYIKDKKKNVIIGKYGKFSYYFALLLKKIEKNGDFENYINILKNEPNNEETLTIFTIILNSLNYIHNQYIDENKEIFKTAFDNFINSLNDENIKNLNKNLIESMTKIFEDDNNYEENLIEKEFEEGIILNLAIKKIKTDFFDKRLQGIKLLNEYINKNKNNETKLLNICVLLKNNIIEEIFGPNFHSQIISKSFEIVKLLIRNRILEEKEVNLIWGCTQKGDLEVKRTIISLLMGLIYEYDENFIGILLDAIINNSNEKSNEKESEFVYRLSLEVQSEENKLKICKYFCNNILELDNFSEKNPIFEKLLKLIKQDENYIKQSLEICEQSIKENKNTLLCYSLIIALIHKNITINNKNNPPYSSEKNSLMNFLKDEHLFKIFENNFKYYMEISKKKLESQNSNSDIEIIIDGYTHKKNIKGRLDFLRELTLIYPNYYFFQNLKDLLFDKPLFQEDKIYFYDFIESYCFPSNENFINETKNRTKLELFNIFAENEQSKMCYREFKLFILSYFYINSNKFYFRINKKNNDDEYIIKLKENSEKEENKEIDQLWKIIVEVNDEKIINKLINIIYEIEPNKQSIINNIGSLTDGEENFEKIQKCYNLLELFFIESEKKSLINIKSHYSLLRNSIIKFPLEINKEKNSSNVIQLFYDNTSLNDIKEEIMKKYKIPIEYIEAYLKKENQEIQLGYKYNNKSLKEILFDDPNINKNNIHIKFNDILYFKVKKIEIEDLIVNKDFTPTFKNILREQFEQFAEVNGKMDKKNCTECISKILNQNKKELEDKIKNLFEKYDKDNGGYITKEIFFQIYLDLILENGGNINKIFSSLDKMGYNQYLRKKDDSLEIKHVENSELFRVITIGNEEFMNAFIDYFNKYPQLNYNFLFFFPTKKDIYEEILEKFNNDSEAFNIIFRDDSNVLKQLYYFIIIESFLQDIELNYINPENIFKNSENMKYVLSSRKYEPFETYDIDKKKKFLIDFIKNKIFEKLIQYNTDILRKYKESKNELLKICCLKGLKIMKIIFEACLGIKISNNLIEENVYYLDYSNIKNVLKEEKEARDIVLNNSYSLLYKNLHNYLTENIDNIDDLYNDCFDKLIILLAFKNKLLDDIISDENSKNIFYNLIKKNLTSNSGFIIKCLTDTLKKIFSIPNSSNNRFIELIYGLMESIINSILNNENKSLFLSNEFFEFFTQINDCIYNVEKGFKNKLILRIIEILINNINEKNRDKKLSNIIFIKYLELIIKLIEKNSNIRQQIASYKIKDESLASAILEKIILGNFNYKEAETEDNEKSTQYTNNEKKFILIENKEDEDIFTEEELKKTCINFIFTCLKGPNEENIIKEKIKLNKILTKNLEIEENNNKVLSNNNYSYTNQLKVCGYVGLHNLGSICYMNSILQQLFMVPSFRYAIMGSDDYKIPESLSIEKYGINDDNLFHQLQVMFTFLTLSEKKDFNPKYFCNSYKDYNGKPINVNIQQDSQEFYNNFIDKIDNGLKNTRYKYIIKDVFTGKICNSIFCQSCRHISYNFEHLNNLTLEVNNINNLNESLKKFILPESVDNFKCEGCNKLVTIQKRTTLYQLPNVLVIYLKRFSMDYEFNMANKTNSKFDFPEKINLKNYCIEMFKNKEKMEADNIYFKDDDYYEYVLKGINVHSGNANGGHYISLIDTKREGKGNTMNNLKENENSYWLKFDDSNLSQFDPKDIPSQCYGGENLENSQSAYLLIYEKIKKSPVKILMDEEYISKKENINIINFSKDEEQIINTKYDIRKTNNIKEEELYKLIFHNKDNNEYYKYIPYYNIQKCAPKEIYNKVIQDNISISRNKTKQINKNINIEDQNKLKDLLYSEIPSKNFIEEIKNFSHNDQCDLVNILLFDIFQKIKNKNLTEQEKVEINNKMNLIINNIIEPLINEKTNLELLEIIQKYLITKDNIELIFSNDNPIFIEKNVDLIYKTIITLIKEINDEKQNTLSNIFEIFIKHFKNIKTKQKYIENEESNTIKYIYQIISEFLQLRKDFSEICIKENLVFLLILGIEKQNPSNQEIILFILQAIIKETEDYERRLYYTQNENLKPNKPEIKEKNKIKKLFYKNSVLNLFYEKDKELLFKLLQIFEYEDKNFSKKFNLNNLPFLLENSIKTGTLPLFIKLCYNLLDIKDDYCLDRMKQIMGFPTMIIKPRMKIDNNIHNNKNRWPLFGFELIKNEKNLKTEIFKYTCFYKRNKLCILSYLLPYSNEINNNKKFELLNENNIKEMAKELILKCFFSGGNYYLFKYLYLLPARSLYYKNAYEELFNIISDNSSINFDILKDIEKFFIDKVNYELNEIYKKRNLKYETMEKPELPKEINESNPDIKIISEFIGFKPDFIPGEIVREEFQSIIKTKYLQLIRIEYRTKYYKIDEIKNKIKENKSIKENDKQIDKKETINEEDKIIKIDISNSDYNINENQLFENISNKLKKAKKIIIEDGSILDNENIITTFIRYVFINKKPINNKLETYINYKSEISEQIKDNSIIPCFTINNVDKNNYVDIFDIYRINKDEKFIEKDDILIQIDSRAYLNN